MPCRRVSLLAHKRQKVQSRCALYPRPEGRGFTARRVNLERLHDLLVEALVIEDARRAVDVRKGKKCLQNYLLAIIEKATNTAVRRL